MFQANKQVRPLLDTNVENFQAMNNSDTERHSAINRNPLQWPFFDTVSDHIGGAQSFALAAFPKLWFSQKKPTRK